MNCVFGKSFEKSTIVRNKSVLVIELNPYHAETLMGNIQYFKDLGYSVDVFMQKTSLAENPFCRFDLSGVRIFAGEEKDIINWVHFKNIADYDFMFLNSYVYFCKDSLLDLFKGYTQTKYGVLGVEHNFLSITFSKFKDIFEQYKNWRLFVLSDQPNVARLNPCFFGDVKVAKKHKNETVFLVIGMVMADIKNANVLFDAVRNLAEQKIYEFKVVVVGNIKVSIPEDIAKYFEIKGRLNFKDMFDEIEKADFLILPMDPTAESNQGYFKGQTSGSLQLSLGFSKPLIINQKLGEIYALNSGNALLYDDLFTEMKKAVLLSDAEYDMMQVKIKKLAEKVYMDSKKNLENKINKIKNNRIPVVFAFDNNYALPASIAIKSLLDSKLPDTEYDVIVLHDGTLKNKVIQKMEEICPIIWVRVDDKFFENVPTTSSWPKSVYYRLMIADLLPQYDKVIWSDVDVLFKGDLSDTYNMDLQDADWAGVIAEKQDEKHGVHTHFPENKHPFIYMSGFMVVNSKQWREKNLMNRFMDTINRYKTQLRMFDLEVLNLSCDKILPVPFEYCVLENLYDAYDVSWALEYPWLVNVYGKDKLENAKKNPIIIHYAGQAVKVWLRRIDRVCSVYLEYLLKSPFFDAKYYFPDAGRKFHKRFLWLVIKLCPVKKWRTILKAKRKNLFVQ